MIKSVLPTIVTKMVSYHNMVAVLVLIMSPTVQTFVSSFHSLGNRMSGGRTRAQMLNLYCSVNQEEKETVLIVGGTRFSGPYLWKGEKKTRRTFSMIG